jgi:hypothetical protein
MPRLRRKQAPPPPPPGELEMAICMEEFRTGAVAPLIRRWQQLPLDHPAVRAHPQFFRGLVRLDEGVKDG